MFLRQLIVVLEDRKVHPDVFLKIQADALADVKGAQESIATACRFLLANGLGWGFSLRYILEQLGKLGLDLEKRPKEKQPEEKRPEEKRPEIARIDDDPDSADDSPANVDPDSADNNPPEVDPIDTNVPQRMILNNNFMLSTLKFAEFHVLRDIKHRARIPLKDSHVLVGVADEGPEYRSRGIKKINDQKVYCLSPENVFGAPRMHSSKRTLRLKMPSVCIQERDDPEPRYLHGPCLVSRNPVVHPGDGRYCLS